MNETMKQTLIDRMKEYNRIHAVDHIILNILAKNDIDNFDLSKEIAKAVKDHYSKTYGFIIQEQSYLRNRLIETEEFIADLMQNLRWYNVFSARNKCAKFLRNCQAKDDEFRRNNCID